MDHDALLARILRAVDAAAYHTPTASAPADQRAALDEVGRAIRAGSAGPETLRARLAGLLADGRIDRVRYLSALGVLAASPGVADYALALRLAGEQELASYELDRSQGGGRLETDLASVERHRGVAFFLAGQIEAALDHFTRALEYERTPENTGNVLATLLRLGELSEAEAILARVRRAQPSPFVFALEHAIDTDPDLAALRSPEAS